SGILECPTETPAATPPSMNEPTSRPVALVTGGARRIGATIVESLHDAGYAVAIHYRSSSADAEALAAKLEAKRPGSTLLLQADLADTRTLTGLVEKTLSRFGRLDALVNNASGFRPTPI